MRYRRIALHQRIIANSKHFEAVLNQAAQRNRARKHLRAKQVEKRNNIRKKLRAKLLLLEILTVIMSLASSFSCINIILGNDSIWIDLTGLVIIMSFILLLIQNKRLRKLF